MCEAAGDEVTCVDERRTWRGRESLRRSDDDDVPKRARVCCVRYSNSAAAAARAKRECGGRQLYMMHVAWWMREVPAKQVSATIACAVRADARVRVPRG